MKRYNSFNELVADTRTLPPDRRSNMSVFNMSPTSVEFGNMKLSVAGEDENKPPHVHATFPGRSIKFVLGSDVKEIAVAPQGIKGNVTNDDLATAMEQVKANYDKLKQDYKNQFDGIPIQKIVGKKVKGNERKRLTDNG
jgi:hypothetical protein